LGGADHVEFCGKCREAIQPAGKGAEKSWGETGVAVILQLRGDQRSDDQPLEGFWEHRQALATSQRPYRWVT